MSECVPLELRTEMDSIEGKVNGLFKKVTLFMKQLSNTELTYPLFDRQLTTYHLRQARPSSLSLMLNLASS